MTPTMLTRDEFVWKLLGKFEGGISMPEHTPAEEVNVGLLNSIAALTFGVPFFSRGEGTLKDMLDDLYEQYTYKK